MHVSNTLADRMSGRIRLAEHAGGKKTLVGRALRATTAGGRIMGIRLPERPKDVVCIQAAGIPGSNRIILGGVSIPILLNRDIRWKGQEILLAAGPDPLEVEDWLSRVETNIDNRVRGRKPGPTEKTFEKGNPSTAFRDAFQIVEESVEILPSADTRYPSHTVCVRDGSHYVIHIATPWPSSVRRGVANALKINKGQIDIRHYPVYPSLGFNFWHPVLEACHAALLSQKARRSVRLSCIPSETAVPELPGAKFKIRAAVDAKGKILASEVDFTVSAGAYLPLENEFIQRVVLGIFSLYPCTHYSIHGKIAHAPLAPSNIGPAAGFELGFLAGELLASKIAANSMRAPDIWHKKSLQNAGASFGTGISPPKDFSITALLDKAIRVSDFSRRNASYEQIRLTRKLHRRIPNHYRGIGLSTAWFGNGFLCTSRSLGTTSLSLTLDRNGELEVGLPTHKFDEGLLEAWSKILANELKIDKNSITFSFKLPNSGPEPGPSILGRSISIYTKLLDLAANELTKLRFREALPITITRTYRRSGARSWNANLLEGSPFEAISYCAGVIEVSFSTATMEVLPVRLWLVMDGGSILAPKSAKAAIEVSVQKTLKWCGFRQEYNRFPEVNIQFFESIPKRQSKDVSTLPQLVIPAAFLQATRQAANLDVCKLPVAPDTLAERGERR